MKQINIKNKHNINAMPIVRTMASEEVKTPPGADPLLDFPGYHALPLPLPPLPAVELVALRYPVTAVGLTTVPPPPPAVELLALRYPVTAVGLTTVPSPPPAVELVAPLLR